MQIFHGFQFVVGRMDPGQVSKRGVFTQREAPVHVGSHGGLPHEARERGSQVLPEEVHPVAERRLPQVLR